MELNGNDPGFNFGANLETCDSVSSLNNLGIDEEEELPAALLVASSPTATSEAVKENPSQTSGKWEDFENGKQQEVAVGNGVGTAMNEAEVSSPTTEQGIRMHVELRCHLVVEVCVVCV